MKIDGNTPDVVKEIFSHFNEPKEIEEEMKKRKLGPEFDKLLKMLENLNKK